MADNVASNNVEITEVSSAEVNTASNGVQQPIPIVEEPNNNKVPQLNVIPEGNPSSENTVITEIINNPKQDVLAAALKSAKAKPVPNKQTTIMREPGAPDLPPAANTIFILDLMKQKEEKLRRKKKDDKILEMALKMKKEKEEKKKSGNTYSYNAGGFLGVGHLTSNKPLPGKSPQIHRKVSHCIQKCTFLTNWYNQINRDSIFTKLKICNYSSFRL